MRVPVAFLQTEAGTAVLRAGQRTTLTHYWNWNEDRSFVTVKLRSSKGRTATVTMVSSPDPSSYIFILSGRLALPSTTGADELWYVNGWTATVDSSSQVAPYTLQWTAPGAYDAAPVARMLAPHTDRSTMKALTATTVKFGRGVTLAGTLTRDGKPLANTLVKVGGKSARTDRYGRWIVRLYPTLTRTYRAVAYLPYKQTVTSNGVAVHIRR